MKGTIIGSLIIGSLIYLVVHTANKHSSTCFAAHGGKEYATERPYTKLENGCEIKEVDKFDDSCYYVKTLYYTTCPGTVNWREHHGKTYTDLSNTTEIK